MVCRKDHKAGTNADIRLSNTQSTKGMFYKLTC